MSVLIICPQGPCSHIVTTWVLKGLLYHDFGAYVYTIVVLGPLGIAISHMAQEAWLYDGKEPRIGKQRSMGIVKNPLVKHHNTLDPSYRRKHAGIMHLWDLPGLKERGLIMAHTFWPCSCDILMYIWSASQNASTTEDPT